MKFNSWFISVLILFFAGFFTVKVLFIPGFFPMHDDTQPARVSEMATALKDGMFPVRWSANLGYGYGYPIFNFYGPFAYYFGGFINLLVYDVLLSTKITMIFAMVFAGFAMYLLARAFWGEYGGVVSALLYLYAPYHALNLYVRGDLAELFAYAFIPIIFLSIYKIYHYIEDTKRDIRYIYLWCLIGSIGYAGLITSHNLTALMITPYLFVYVFVLVLYRLKKQKFNADIIPSKTRFYKLWLKNRVVPFVGLPLLIGILLSGFYWLPALSEMKYTNVLSQVGGKADYRLHFVCPMQLWESPWGFGGSIPGCTDGMSFRIGKIHIVMVLLVSFLLLVFRKNVKNFLFQLTIIGFIFLSVWLTTSSSRIIWENIPLMNFFQFPWRFLLPISFFSSLLSGSIILLITENIKIFHKIKYFKFLFSAFILVLIFLHYEKLFQSQTILPKTSRNYISEVNLKWKISKISDEYMPTNFSTPESPNDIVKNKLDFIDGSGKLLFIKNKTQSINAIVEVNERPTQALIKTAYFPAWNLYLDKKPYKYEVTEKGLIVKLPEGKHELALIFKQTQIQKYGNILTLCGIIILGLGIISILPNSKFSLTRHGYFNKN